MPVVRFSKASSRPPCRTSRWSKCFWGPHMASEILRAKNLQAGYGRVQVLWGVELAVGAAQTVVLLGANGAGKTTLIKTVMGLITPWQGEIVFNGVDLTRARTDKRVRAGMSYMSE